MIERYRVEQRMDSETIIVRDDHGGRLIARCDSTDDARLVVGALNRLAAVNRLRNVVEAANDELAATAEDALDSDTAERIDAVRERMADMLLATAVAPPRTDQPKEDR